MGIADFYIMSITPDTQEGFYIWVIASEEEPVLYHFTPSETVGDYSGKAGKSAVNRQSVDCKQFVHRGI